MKHLGDITRISGYDIEPVWVVTGGSPCQDLSSAGLRAGLTGKRSGLFMEQIRVVKEMRENERRNGRTDEYIRPRYMVWENVLGALSSNNGRDFAVVLEEIIKIAEPQAPHIPVPEHGWPNWGGFRDVDGRWSVAYRVHDAQWWGVPQRRRRISVVADLGGLTAHEILFERKSMYGDSAQSGPAGKETPAGVGNRAEDAIYCLATQQGGAELRTDDKAPTLTAAAGMSGNNQPVVCLTKSEAKASAYRISSYCSNAMLSANPMSGAKEVQTANTLDRNGGDPTSHQGGVCIVQPVQSCVHEDNAAVCAGFKPRAGATAGSVGYEEEKSPTLDTGKPMAILDARGNGDGKTACTIIGDHESRVTDYTAIVLASGQANAEITQALSPTLTCYHERPIVAHALRSQGNDPFREDAATYPIIGGRVRRLTPLECERLQGFPDGWTDVGKWVDSKGKLHKESSDSARYKALGNSIALPFWKWLLERISAYLPPDATLGSLFDGIGGFPLCWAEIHGAEACRWASEIEEFPIAVTKRHFGEENANADI